MPREGRNGWNFSRGQSSKFYIFIALRTGVATAAATTNSPQKLISLEPNEAAQLLQGTSVGRTDLRNSKAA